MSVEVNKAVARRLYDEAITQQRPEVLEEIVAADAIDETAATAGREGFPAARSAVAASAGSPSATVRSSGTTSSPTVSASSSNWTARGELPSGLAALRAAVTRLAMATRRPPPIRLISSSRKMP
jgi:hypothetical protein